MDDSIDGLRDLSYAWVGFVRVCVSLSNYHLGAAFEEYLRLHADEHEKEAGIPMKDAPNET